MPQKISLNPTQHAEIQASADRATAVVGTRAFIELLSSHADPLVRCAAASIKKVVDPLLSAHRARLVVNADEFIDFVLPRSARDGSSMAPLGVALVRAKADGGWFVTWDSGPLYLNGVEHNANPRAGFGSVDVAALDVVKIGRTTATLLAPEESTS